jgi:hypothetical protein
MLLAVPQHPVARAYVLKRAEDELDHMLNLPVGIFDDPVVREAHQTGGQPLDILPALHFTQAPRIEPLTHEIEFGLGHRVF